MPLSEKAEEILETLWIEQFEKGRKEVGRNVLAQGLEYHTSEGEKTPRRLPEIPEVQELLAAGLVEMRDGKGLALTAQGEKEGKQVVRNHRLAERLLADVFDMTAAAGEEVACRFEHMLKSGIDERICTLLGHPCLCPHGLRIPPGPCCEEKRATSIRVVSPLSELKEGESGTIAYLHTGEKGRLERLLALGVLPGQPITLVQRFPSYLFRVGQTQVAVDDDLAGHIFVRPSGQSGPRRRRRGWLRR
jgi:DtxR family Mn-dependent transcriptional regulator